jgi:hypothetical protein
MASLWLYADDAQILELGMASSTKLILRRYRGWSSRASRCEIKMDIQGLAMVTSGGLTTRNREYKTTNQGAEANACRMLKTIPRQEQQDEMRHGQSSRGLVRARRTSKHVCRETRLVGDDIGQSSVQGLSNGTESRVVTGSCAGEGYEGAV